jgi:hypothetical protein
MFSRLLAYAALPAISVFVLLGATVFGAKTIRRIQNENAGATSSRRSFWFPS